MAVKTREDILTAIRAKLGEQTDDDTIALLEDVTDTFTDLEEKANGDGTHWKKKYEETDEAWRKNTQNVFTVLTQNQKNPILTQKQKKSKIFQTCLRQIRKGLNYGKKNC